MPDASLVNRIKAGPGGRWVSERRVQQVVDAESSLFRRAWALEADVVAVFVSYQCTDERAVAVGHGSSLYMRRQLSILGMMC